MLWMEEWRMQMKLTVRVVCIACALFFVGSLLSAEEVTINWQWEPADEEITAFRYQLDAEEEDQWTVVDASVTQFSIGPVDGSVPHTLYVQQSYDGQLWSESSALTYEPAAYGVAETPEEQETVEKVVPEEMPEEEVAQQAPVKEEAEQEEEVVATQPSSPEPIALPIPDTALVPEIEEAEEPGSLPLPRMGMEVLVGGGIKAEDASWIFPSFAVDYVHDNLWPLNEAWGLGVRAGLGYQDANSALSGFDIHALAKFNWMKSAEIAFDAAVGLSFFVDTTGAFFFGPVVQVNIRDPLDEFISLGLQVEGRGLFDTSFGFEELTGVARLGIGYRF